MSDAFVPIRGLHHFAWRCRDCEETRHFYEDLLGLPLVHVIRSDVVPSTGEHCPYVHVFFQMADGSHIAFFDLAQKAGWADYDAGDANLIAMPNFHVAGVNMGLVTTGQGARGIIMKQVEPARVLDFIARYQINNMFLVPAVIQFLLQVPDADKTDFSSLRRVFYGASPISEDVLLRATKLFGCEFTQLYGLTETVGAGTAGAGSQSYSRRSSSSSVVCPSRRYVRARSASARASSLARPSM
jgi:acyl-CoA synthetase (AMP-forming)/AMP-acid ligase II